jgi:hypothetical protein
MKRTTLLALTAFVLTLVINTPFACAQSARANVPFDFAVAGKWMPAGTYTVSEIGDCEIRVSNTQSNATALVLTQREERLDHQSARLVFQVYGDKYFLAEAWSGSGKSGMEFPIGKEEHELRAASKNAGGPDQVVVALR